MIEDQTRIGNHDCIKFKQSKIKDYIYLYSDDGCWSTIGKQRTGGRQLLSLHSSKSYSCLHIPTVAHELIHALGNGYFILKIQSFMYTYF